eukprot:scaffold2765_cov328-Prasinococcus_capsulatus_cf.AAC.5
MGITCSNVQADIVQAEDLAQAVQDMDGLQVQLAGADDPEREEYLSYLRALVFDVQKLMKEYLYEGDTATEPNDEL